MAMAALLGLTTCVAPRSPPPAPPLVPPPPPRVVPPPIAGADWHDWPLTPGAWTYVPGAATSESRFGESGAPPAFTVRCDATQRRIALIRAAAAPAAPATMAVTSSAGDRAWRVDPLAGGFGVALAASDPFLDAMAFSRGRFIVAVTGTPRLVIPSWPEFARVVEDCR